MRAGIGLIILLAGAGLAGEDANQAAGAAALPAGELDLNGQQHTFAAPEAVKNGSPFVFWFKPGEKATGPLATLGEVSADFRVDADGWDRIFLLYTDGGKKNQTPQAVVTPHHPVRWHRLELHFSGKTPSLILDSGSQITGPALTKDNSTATVSFGAGVQATVRGFGVAEKDAKPFSGILGCFDFEDENSVKLWIQKDRRVSAGQPDGALGSHGFLHVGPQTTYWVSARDTMRYAIGEDTWLGFSARRPGGGSLELRIANCTKSHNVNRRFNLASDGSWTHVFVPLIWLDLTPGTQCADVQFHMPNGNLAPMFYDVDNVVLGCGKDFDPPQAAANLRVEVKEATAHVSWTATFALGGVREFRVYRGLHPAFPRDAAHLVAVREQADFSDEAFAHPGDYYYSVRAVDFVGHEGADTEAVKATVR